MAAIRRDENSRPSAVRRKRGELRAGFPSLGDFQIGVGTVHIGPDPARMGRVDLDRGVAQFVGEMNSESAFNAVFDAS